MSVNSQNFVVFTYVERGGMLFAIRHDICRKRDDGALAHGSRKSERYRERTKLRPIEYCYRDAKIA